MTIQNSIESSILQVYRQMQLGNHKKAELQLGTCRISAYKCSTNVIRIDVVEKRTHSSESQSTNQQTNQQGD